jgi:hypothetical protein
MRKGKPPVGERLYQFKITLRHIRPAVWRRLQVLGDTSLGELHRVIQVAMGWSDSHLHLFRIGKTEYSQPDPEDPFWGRNAVDERSVAMAEVAPSEGSRFLYLYDFGDDWEHDIRVEKILVRPERHVYPACVEGRRACPPEDCGGSPGYGHLLKALRNPWHPEHVSLLEWVGGSFDPEAFDLEGVNRRLRFPELHSG